MKKRLPAGWWVLPTLLFIVAQAIATLFLAVEKDRQEAIPFGDEGQYFVQEIPADPPWSLYVAGWNGQGYREIALNGYPTEIPVDAEGRAYPTTWAFYPLYPLTARVVMLTGLDFGPSAVIVSLAFGLGAVLLLYRLLYSYSGKKWVGTLGAGSLLLWPAAPLFQLAYAESMALFLLVTLLTLVHEKKYLAAIPVVLLLGLTRPVGPPDFLIVVLHGLYHARYFLPPVRWSEGIRKAVRSDQAWKWAGLAFASGVSTLVWPLLSYLATGKPAFFMAREAYSSESFFGAWITMGFEASPAYPYTPALLAGLFTLWALAQLRNRAIPPILRTWPIVLLAYVLTVTQPLGNEIRYLFLGLFLWPWMRIPDGRGRRLAYFTLLALAVLAGLYLQYSWVATHWVSEAGALRKNV